MDTPNTITIPAPKFKKNQVVRHGDRFMKIGTLWFNPNQGLAGAWHYNLVGETQTKQSTVAQSETTLTPLTAEDLGEQFEDFPQR